VSRRVRGRHFDLVVALPHREQVVRIIATAKDGRQSQASVRHVLGLPSTARPRGSLPRLDPALARRIVPLVRSFPGSSAVYVRDLQSGTGAAWNARAAFPAASTLKLAIAVEVLRTLRGKPAPGSYADSLLRRALVYSDNDAANGLEVLVGGSTSGGSARVNALMRGIGLVDTEMYGGYERGTAPTSSPTTGTASTRARTTSRSCLRTSTWRQGARDASRNGTPVSRRPTRATSSTCLRTRPTTARSIASSAVPA
jgi:hypothetical protein